MTVRIEGSQQNDNKTGFSMEQLKGMTKQKLLTVFDANNSGSISDKEITSKGFGDAELQELRTYMDEQKIEKEVRETKAGFTMDEFNDMTKEQLLGIFDKNSSGTISKQELKAKGIEDEYVAELNAKVRSLGIEETEKAGKNSTVAKNNAVAGTNSTAKPKSTQATTQSQSTTTRKIHSYQQVSFGHAPRKVTPPKDIRIPKEITVQSWGLDDLKKRKEGNWYFSYNDYGRVHKIYRADKNGECAKKETFHINSDDTFVYKEYNSNGKLTLRYYSPFDENFNTEYTGSWWDTYEYDDKGRVIRSIKYDRDGKPTRLDEIKYDNYNKAYHTVYWENQLDKLKPGQVLPYQEPRVTTFSSVNSMLNIY